MKFEEPGRKLLRSSVVDILDLQKDQSTNFIDIGCGAGSLSHFLLKRGMFGVGVESSDQAYEQCQHTIAEDIELGTFKLFRNLNESVEKFDLVICINVLEHISDDGQFLQKILNCLKPGGLLIIGVPGREDRWYLEDSLVGHLRRYSIDGLRHLIEHQTKSFVEVWSIGFPLMNIGQRLKNILLKISRDQYSNLPKDEQTLTSGIRNIPLFQNLSFFEYASRITVRFLFIPLQRRFYKSNRGIQLIAHTRSRSD